MMSELSPMMENGHVEVGVSDEDVKSPVLQLVFRDVNVHTGGRLILKNISGVAQEGHLLAIMGPSGCGKTTLLNALAGRIGLQSGEITINKRPLDKQLKRKVSYVLQEDIFFTGLTLRETLMFATMMRLPDYMPHKDKLARMDDIINVLDLRGCLDTVIGDAMNRGLSGGEKKRANIACELITDPAIILMDEPTSGLDYSSALSLIEMLKKYTEDRNKMVITTIHQPSSQIFFQFDKLLLMSDGELAYFGDAGQNVIKFFSNIGMPLPEHYNPADFIAEKMKADDVVKQKIVDAAYQLRESESWPVVLRSKSSDGDIANNTPGSKRRKLSIKTLTHSPIYKKVSKKLKNTDVVYDPEFGGSMDMLNFKADTEKWPTGFLMQFKQLTVRTFRNSRSRILSRLRLLEAVLLCVLVSLIWFQLPRIEETLRDRMGVIFFIAIHWTFSPLFDAVYSFPTERVVIQKERAAGWYRLSAYYSAKMVSELPLIVLCPTVFILIVYWSVGLNGAGPFFATIITVVIGAICGQSIGLFLGIVCMDMQRASSIATLVMMGIMLLGGFYTRNLPFWVNWIKYLSFLHYTFHSLMVLEFSGDNPVQCASSGSASMFERCLNPNVTSVSNQEVLEFYDISSSYVAYLFPVLFFIILFRFLGYLVLRFAYRPSHV